MKTKYCVVMIILILSLVSCSDSSRLEKTKVLSGKALDAVDLAIVITVMNDASMRPELSEGLKQRLAKYNTNTTFELSCNRLGRKPVEVEGVRGAVIGLFPNSEFRCKYKGDLKYLINFRGGVVGVIKREIYVQEGTKLSIDDNPFVFSKGKWIRSG